jgi:hypothetical protein
MAGLPYFPLMVVTAATYHLSALLTATVPLNVVCHLFFKYYGFADALILISSKFLSL